MADFTNRNADETKEFILTFDENGGSPEYTKIEDANGVDRTAEVVELLGINDKEDADSTILKEGDVEDSLNSTSTTKPLSANQGKQLNDDKASLSAVKEAYSSSINLDVSGDPNFTSGELELTRSFDQVVVSVLVDLVHPSGSIIQSENGFIPQAWRPTSGNSRNVYSFNGFGTLFLIEINSDGRLLFQYLDIDGSGVNRTNTGTSPTITYNSIVPE